MMYYVIIVVLLNIVCVTLIAAPFHLFGEIVMEFLEFAPSPLGTFTVARVSD